MIRFPLLLMAAVLRAAEPAEDGLPKGLAAAGKGFSADATLLRVLPEPERGAALDAISKFVVRRRFGGNPEFTKDNQFMADSMAALLKDMLRGRSGATHTQIYFPQTTDAGVVEINEFSGGTVLQTATKWERTGTGWGVGDGLSPYGLSVYVRNARAIDDTGAKFIKPFQLLGGWGMEVFATKVESNTGGWFWWATGPKTWETPIVRRLYRTASNTWEDKNHQVEGRPATLYEAPGIIGQYYNQVNETIGLPPLFTQSPDCQGADLKDQFVDGPTRNQCSVGSCHIFASIGPIETALYRAYGVKVRLSEADLFVGNKVTKKDMYRDATQARDADGKPLDYLNLSEGGYEAEDMEYALAHGVATNRSFPYEEMLDRYYKYREAEGKTMDGLMKNYAKEDFLAKFFHNPQNQWAELQESETSRKSTERLLAGKAEGMETIEKQREAVKKALEGFKVIHNRYNFLDAGLSQQRDITRLLCKGIPVAVGMNLVGLKEWGVTDTSRDAMHAFLITGFSTTGGGVVFKTRNSWGRYAAGIPTNNPDIPEGRFSRILGVTAVLAPGEPGRASVPADRGKALAALNP